MYGSNERNERGEKLVQFALENELSILNTFFKKNIKQRWTWLSPDGNIKNETEYNILCYQIKESTLQNTEVMRKIQFQSDHRLVRSTLSIKEIKNNRKSFQPKSTLQKTHEKENYISRLSNNLPRNLESYSTVQECYNQIEASIKKSINETKCQKSDTNRFHLTKEIKHLIERRHNLQSRKPLKIIEKMELGNLYKTINKKIRKEYESHRIQVYEKYLNSHSSITRGQKILKCSKDWITKLKSGKDSTGNRDNILQIATDFYKTLYTKKNIPTDDQITSMEMEQESENNNNPEKFSLKEVIQSIRKLKKLKKPRTRLYH